MNNREKDKIDKKELVLKLIKVYEEKEVNGHIYLCFDRGKIVKIEKQEIVR
jgi:hypothetical protein